MSYAIPARGRKPQNHKAVFNFVAILALLASLLLQIAGPSTPAASAHALDASAANSAYARDLQPSSGQPAAGFGVEAFTGGIVQEFYVPMPEAQIRQAFLKLASNTGTEFESVISIVVPVAGTVVVLDHWEDGYEVDLNNPAQSTTRIWGDGDDANGIAPGFANDPNGLPAGQVLAPRNLVPLPRNGAILFDGARPRRRHAGRRHDALGLGHHARLGAGRRHRGPVDGGLRHQLHHAGRRGRDLPDAAHCVHVRADCPVRAGRRERHPGPDRHRRQRHRATTTVTLNRGESYLVNGGIRKGATVTASKPVQVQLLTGDIGANYESRWFTIPPTERLDLRVLLAGGHGDRRR